jgi:prepilin-type N-terminal cleavage/methylation domain-containing protein
MTIETTDEHRWEGGIRGRLIPGSAGVAPAVFGVTPETFHRKPGAEQRADDAFRSPPSALCSPPSPVPRPTPPSRVTRHSSPVTPRAAFTLIELLTVVAILALIAALVGPVVSNFRKGDSTLSATRQLLNDVGIARRTAISQRTTVYMIFVPTNFWLDPARPSGANNAWSRLPMAVQTSAAASNLMDKQITGYNFVSLRRMGDQPGQNTPQYLSEWKTLPDSSFIALQKFYMTTNYYSIITNSTTGMGFNVRGFLTTNTIPFPIADVWTNGSPYVTLPYVAFNYQGQLVSGQDEFIPLAHGSVLPEVYPGGTKVLMMDPNPPPGSPSVQESPAGNSTNVYNIVHIDWLTGRARLEHQEVQ